MVEWVDDKETVGCVKYCVNEQGWKYVYLITNGENID